MEREEDTEYFNARLNTMIKHKQHCLKMSKATDRKAAIACPTCCKPFASNDAHVIAFSKRLEIKKCCLGLITKGKTFYTNVVIKFMTGLQIIK